MAPEARHQGVIARLSPVPRVELADLIEAAREAPLPLIVALDQVQDAGNAGVLARTIYALGGVGSGMIIALMALALVLTWRATRVVNFAQVGQAMFTTFIALSIQTLTGSWLRRWA